MVTNSITTSINKLIMALAGLGFWDGLGLGLGWAWARLGLGWGLGFEIAGNSWKLPADGRQAKFSKLIRSQNRSDSF